MPLNMNYFMLKMDYTCQNFKLTTLKQNKKIEQFKKNILIYLSFINFITYGLYIKNI